MEERSEFRLKPKLTVMLELGWIVVWTLWLGRAYLRLLKNKLGNSDLYWQFGVFINKHRHLQGGYSHGQGAV